MKKNRLAALFFMVLSLVIIFSWFRDGLIYGGGDVGLQTYDPKRILENASYVWWDSTAPGSPIPQGLSALPFQFFLFLFQLIGFSPLLLQATLFLILLFFMGYGMYSFLEQRLEDKRKIYSVLGGLFYMLNPYMMVQVWHRFIHTTIILAASLPFFAIFWDRWIKKGSLKHLIFFLVANFFAVYIFGTFAFIVTVWIFLLLLTLANLIPWQSRIVFLKIAGRFLFGLIVWVLINCWHLYPVTQISPAILSEQHKSSESIVTLVDISAQAILPFTLQLANPFYLFDHAELGPIYKNPLFQVLPWFFVVTVLIGLITSFRIKSISLYGILFLISIFLVKGAAPPFGNLYIFGFKNIFALGVLRNPFEKTGLILVFFVTVLFTVGLKEIAGFLTTKISTSVSKIVITAIIFSIVLFSWPMLAGRVIGRYDKPAFVQVPESYKLADQWLSKQKSAGISDGKILHLPLTRGESVQYNWKYGYNGLEPSDTFFTSYPSISRGFNISRTDDSLTALSLIFYKPYTEDKSKILQLLQAFNVRFIVLHKDVNWLGGDIYDPKETEKVLDKLEFIERKVEYGDLVIYQISESFFGPKIEISNNISLVYPQTATMKVWPWLKSKQSYLVSPIQDHKLDDSVKGRVTESLIFPENSFSYPEATDSSIENTVKGLDSQLSAMVGTVQYLKQLGTIQTDTESTVSDIVLSSKKLVEIFQGKSISEYSNLVEHFLPTLKKDSPLFFDIAKSNVLDVLKTHEVILSYLERKVNETAEKSISVPKNQIREVLKNENLLPSFPSLDKVTEIGQKQFFDFWVSNAGKYELLLTDSKIKDAYLDGLGKVNFQINDKLQTLTGKEDDNIISFGQIDLKTGLNELSLSTPPAINLITSPGDLVKIGATSVQGDTIQMSISKNSPAAVETPILQTSGGDIYQISFQGQIPANVGLYIQIIQDTDSEDNGQKTPRINFLQHLESSNWEGVLSLKLPAIALQTRQAKIRLVGLIQPGAATLDFQSTLMLKNLRVIRLLNNGVFLKDNSLSKEQEVNNLDKVTFKKISAAEYEGNIKLTKPQFLFFKETYHPGWKLQLSERNQLIVPNLHYLGYLYGNVWWVDKIGEYKFKIVFEPQEYLYTGMLLTAAGILSLLIYALAIKKMKR